MKAVRFGLIVCPTAAISMKAPQELSLTGGSLAPIDALMRAGVSVYIGGDNRADVYNPNNSGNMLNEVRFAGETLRCYDDDLFARMVTDVPFFPSPQLSAAHITKRGVLCSAHA